MLIHGDNISVDIDFYNGNIDFGNIAYIKSNISSEFNFGRQVDIPVRSLEEIALEKDLSWLKKKNYYIVDDDEIAEKIFAYLENYNGPIAYDTETTGLKINMFSKVNSLWQRMLQEYNASRRKDRIEVDRLVDLSALSPMWHIISSRKP